MDFISRVLKRLLKAGSRMGGEGRKDYRFERGRKLDANLAETGTDDARNLIDRLQAGSEDFQSCGGICRFKVE